MRVATRWSRAGFWLLAAGSVRLPLWAQAIDRSRLVPAPGAVHSEVASARDLGPRDPSALLEHMQLVLQRPQERQAALDAEVVALHQPRSPSFHQWLTPEVIGAEFGPSASDLATLTGYLRAEGFTINGVGKSGMYVDFSGTVAQVAQSFHTEIHNLRLANGEERYAAVNRAQVPEALAPLVVGFVPIGNILPRPLVRPVVAPVRAPGKAADPFNARPQDTEGGGNYLQRDTADRHQRERFRYHHCVAGTDGH
jgi:hypothetical protein